VQLFTGFFNALNWYPWSWSFVPVHRFLAYVVIGSILLHIGVKLPDIKYGLSAKVADADVLTEIPWSENPNSHSNAGTVAPPRTPALSRRGLLAATGVGIDGAADEHRLVDVDDRRELRHRLADGRRRTTIEDDADGPLVVVRRDQHHRPLEVRVHDRRRGDQEVAGKGVHGLSLHYAANVPP